MNLTATQLQLADTGQPVRLRDPATNGEYVLIRADVFERVKLVLDEGLDEQQVARLIDKNMREYDEADPLLPLYQKQQ